LLRLDLFSGRAEFLRSGAAPAYLLRDGGAVKIECDSFPAGILVSCDPDVYSCKLFDGDIIIMATDGAPEELPERAAGLCADDPGSDAEQLAFRLGSLCSEGQRGRRDDMTIAAVKISDRRIKNNSRGRLKNAVCANV
ncbi:MAG: SpoIIE family protein phosphatase, partial [Ruminococcus sp.]|nr:SpoIIE family protein phosphatase [Ruminococcus sp.]